MSQESGRPVSWDQILYAVKWTVFLPKFVCWSLNLEMGLLGINYVYMRSWGGGPHGGTSAVIRRNARESARSPSPHEEVWLAHDEMLALCQLGRGLSPGPDHATPDHGLRASRIVSKQISAVYAPYLWYFVMITQANNYSNSLKKVSLFNYIFSYID